MDCIYEDFYNRVDGENFEIFEPIEVEDFDELWFIYRIDYIEFITV